MATLNVKNLPDRLHRKLQARAKREHRSVAQEVTLILSAALEEPEPLSILSSSPPRSLRVARCSSRNDRSLPEIPGLRVLQLRDYT